jgi:TRAP-type C4-dicarboxylate transport system permease small subunit
MGFNLTAKLNKIYNRIIELGALIAGVLLIFLMLSVTVEVALRYFLGRPTSWVVEICGYILLYIPFLVAAWVLRRDGHVRMDLMISTLSPKAQSLVNAITSFVSALICFLLTWYGIKVVLYFSKLGYKTPTVLMLPKSMIITIIFIGSFMLAVQFLIRTYNHLRNWREL